MGEVGCVEGVRWGVLRGGGDEVGYGGGEGDRWGV